MPNCYIQNYPDGRVIIEENLLTLTYQITFEDGQIFEVSKFYMAEAEGTLIRQKRYWNKTELLKFCIKESQYIPYENITC